MKGALLKKKKYCSEVALTDCIQWSFCNGARTKLGLGSVGQPEQSVLTRESFLASAR